MLFLIVSSIVVVQWIERNKAKKAVNLQWLSQVQSKRKTFSICFGHIEIQWVGKIGNEMNPLDDLILLSILDSLRNIFYVFLKQHKVDLSSSKLFSLCFMAQLNPSILIGPFIVYTTVYPSTIYCHLLYIQIQFCLFKPTVKININTQHLAYKQTLNIFGSSINQIQFWPKKGKSNEIQYFPC